MGRPTGSDAGVEGAAMPCYRPPCTSWPPRAAFINYFATLKKKKVVVVPLNESDVGTLGLL